MSVRGKSHQKAISSGRLNLVVAVVVFGVCLVSIESKNRVHSSEKVEIGEISELRETLDSM